MNAKQAALGAVLVPFLVLTSYVLRYYGLVGFYEIVGTNAVTLLLFIDLSIALGLFMVWMIGDAKGRSFSYVPYLLVMLAVGVAGPLLYLMRREADLARVRQAAQPPVGPSRS
jgi:uncharacterized membrane protein